MAKKITTTAATAKKITSTQALTTIGGNKRLISYVSKVYKDTKTLDEWKKIFEKDNIK